MCFCFQRGLIVFTLATAEKMPGLLVKIFKGELNYFESCSRLPFTHTVFMLGPLLSEVHVVRRCAAIDGGYLGEDAQCVLVPALGHQPPGGLVQAADTPPCTMWSSTTHVILNKLIRGQ